MNIIDFRKITSLAYTKPIGAQYFGKKLDFVGSWSEIYCKLFELLYMDYSGRIPTGCSFFGSGRLDFGDRRQAKFMVRPRLICNEMYLETNLSATDVARKVKALLDICRIEYENIVVKYVDKDVAGTTAKMLFDQKSMGGEFQKNISKISQNVVQKINEFKTGTLKVDFWQEANFAHTRPIKIVYFGKEICANQFWNEVYFELIKTLYKDFSKVIPIGKCFTNGSRVDLGDCEYAKFMKRPRLIDKDKGLYLETNLSATSIVAKIKVILNFCCVKYENVEVYYEHREIGMNNRVVHIRPVSGNFIRKLLSDYEKVSGYNPPRYIKPIRDSMTFSNARKVLAGYLHPNSEAFIKLNKLEVKFCMQYGYSRQNGCAPSENIFDSYLKEKGLSPGTCLSYTSGIRCMERYAKNNHFEHFQIYGSPFEKAKSTIDALLVDLNFLEYDKQQHHRFRSAIEHFQECMNGRTADFTGTVRDISPIDTRPFENVLEQQFLKGFRLNSMLDIKKFKSLYEKINGSSLDINDDEIENVIRRCGFIYDEKVFCPKVMLNENVRKELSTYIKKSFESGVNSIYVDALFQKFSEKFLDSSIYNADMLLSYLAFEYKDRYVIRKNQIAKAPGLSSDPVEDVRACLKSSGRAMKKKELYASLTYLPKNKVDLILHSNLEFVRNSKGEYFHADLLNLSQEELGNVAALIENELNHRSYISGSELMDEIRAKYPRIYGDYSCYSDFGWRDALKYKLSKRFFFKGNVISSRERACSMNDAFGHFAAAAETITMDELLTFANNMGTQIYFDAVYQSALRIDENTFRSKKSAAFQVKETDSILDRFCTGNYIPLSKICNFGIFPDAGFPWTVYLLESYAAFYSERYVLFHGGYNRNCAVGAIAKKNAGYGSFDDLLVDVLTNSDISLNKQKALEFLVESGYIARRSYRNIEDLLIRAKMQRNREGK